jgi:hypothetical protein
LEHQMSEVDESKSDSAEVKSPWTPKVRRLLEDWRKRADDASKTHYAQASRLSALNLILGIPVVVLTTFVGTSVFATLQDPVNTGMRIVVGVVSVAAAVLASLQTFLSFAERAEKHRQAAERWAAMRREITEILALHPSYLATRGDPKNYLDDLRKRMDEIAAESPEMSGRRWKRALEQEQADEQPAEHKTGGRTPT